jgi:hypothetical protein
MSKQKLLIVCVALGSATLGGGIVAVASQPHMVNAKADLRGALSELQAASTDKAGHRVKAIELVKEAIGEVDAGIAAGS